MAYRGILKGCESGINGQAGLSFCASNVHVLSLCQAPVPADSSASVTCSHCHHTSSRYDLLDECTLSPQDQLIDGRAASCSDCGGYETVCEFGGRYLCTQCLTLHDSVGSCDYCSGKSTNVQDNGPLFGCDFCGGNHNLWDEV